MLLRLPAIQQIYENIHSPDIHYKTAGGHLGRKGCPKRPRCSNKGLGEGVLGTPRAEKEQKTTEVGRDGINKSHHRIYG